MIGVIDPPSMKRTALVMTAAFFFDMSTSDDFARVEKFWIGLLEPERVPNSKGDVRYGCSAVADAIWSSPATIVVRRIQQRAKAGGDARLKTTVPSQVRD